MSSKPNVCSRSNCIFSCKTQSKEAMKENLSPHRFSSQITQPPTLLCRNERSNRNVVKQTSRRSEYLYTLCPDQIRRKRTLDWSKHDHRIPYRPITIALHSVKSMRREKYAESRTIPSTVKRMAILKTI